MTTGVAGRVFGLHAAPDDVAAEAAPFFNAGHRLDLEGRYDEAFEAYERGNRVVRACKDVAGAEEQEMVLSREAREVFTPSLFRMFPRPRKPEAPIFIVGLPRSGSTLVEQILASHPRVQGLGELFAFPLVTYGQFPYRGDAPVRFEALKAEYLAAAGAAGWRRWGRFTDKMLSNYLAVGMIDLVFPGSLILHTAREPADTCLSAFTQFFETGNELAYDLADLGRQYRRYREVMDHWEKTLPGRVTEVRYESLVTAPEAAIRRLVTETCGLPWHDRCLRFHESTRSVATASVNQVRVPIYRRSVGRWRHYRRRLGPLMEALGPYAPADA